MKNNNFNIVITGVGGQGVITLTQIIAEAALVEGLDVRTSELHGLSQRGGSVETHIRMGQKVYSPLVVTADLVLSLEMLEALRKIHYADSKTVFLINKNYLSYPSSPKEEKVIRDLELIKKKHIVGASEICRDKLGKEVLSGVYLLSFAVHNNLIPLKPQSVLRAIKKTMSPRYVSINEKAFNLAK